ncbi:MAG: XdhC family protein [Deltaproteobacteria bacterium]|nr:XdhC family protein [Deltaproteobacteria bacterium]
MEPGSGDVRSIAKKLHQLVEQDESGALVLVITSTGSAPGKVGAKMLVLPDGNIHGTIGGGVVEARVIADALDAIEDGRGPRTFDYDLEKLGMTCGGGISVYVEPIVPPRSVIIFGAGHVGSALARLMSTLDCRVTVVDDRTDWASEERLPEVHRVVQCAFTEYLLEEPPGPLDHVIIVTRGHEHDQHVLEQVIEQDVAYIGMIGSRNKAKVALDALLDAGVERERLEKVCTPIGLNIGAVTPVEIAIAVAAELIALWRKGMLESGRMSDKGKKNRSKAR